MTLQQLKYIITIVETGSISTAANKLFITQPSLSKAVNDLEKEMGITIFYRNNRGVYLTEDGTKFLSYARQVIEQADLLEQQYKTNIPTRKVFSISSQHYAFVVNAFVELVKQYDKTSNEIGFIKQNNQFYDDNKYEFTLRESKTYDIIEDVRVNRSEIGILYLSEFNRDVLGRIIKNANLKFTKLFTAKPHVFVGKNNPLAKKDSVKMEELKQFPRLTYEQGMNNSFYFAEELHIVEESPKNIIVTDRATLFNLLIGLNGYTISSGVLSSDLNGNDIVSVPLESNNYMEIGYIKSIERELSNVGLLYLSYLKDYINNYS